MRKLMIFAGLVFVLSAGALVYVAREKLAAPVTSPLTPDASVAGLGMPEFTLTTHDGKPLTRNDLLGHITIVDFMFTNCPFICPKLTAGMAGMASQLEGTPVRFLSVSVDPAHDTPAVLKQYAQDRGIDTSRWTLATGESATLKNIVTGSLKFNLEDEPGTPVNLPGGATMSNISHPGHFILLGPGAEVLGIYHVNQHDQVQTLVERARDAATHLPK